MAFDKFAPVSDANPLPVVSVTPTGSFDSFAPITETNPLPVAYSTVTDAFLPFVPVQGANPMPLDAGPSSGTFSKFAPITESNRLPVALTAFGGVFNKFAPVAILNPLPVFSAYFLPDLAASYSIDGPESDSTYLTNGLGRVRLVTDRSSNSSINGMVCNGDASNSVTAPNKTVTGNQVITYNAALSTWNPAANVTIFSKKSGNDGIECLLLTTGVIRLTIGNGIALTNYDTTAAMSASAFLRRTIVITYVDGLTGTLDVTVNGVALGTQVSTIVTLTNAAVVATFGMVNTIGIVYGTTVSAVYDNNPSAAAKLAATYSSGGDTYTVNTSGDTGIRISGARDIYQGTTSKMALLSVGADGRNIATFDGSNDFMRAAAFSLIQPVSVYFSGYAVSWTSGDSYYDGNSVNTARVLQTGSTPSVSQQSNLATGNAISPALGTRYVISSVWSGAASSNRLNLANAVTGTNVGTVSINGVTIGAAADISTFSNIAFSEVLIRSVADDTATQLRIANLLMKKWGVS